MPDITKCDGNNCELRNECWRFVSADSMRQAYFIEPPINDNGECDYFLDIEEDK
jgi:hypothetical protein